MSEQKISAGKEVLSYCGKCKLTLDHVIVDMKNDTAIGKCECKTCGARHAYRVMDKSPKKAKSSTKKTRMTIPELWKAAMAEAGGDARKYAMSSSFAVGDHIAHASFGPGIVQRNIGKTKIEVLFEANVKLLVCGQ